MVRRNVHSALPLSASRERLLLFLNVLCAAVSAVIIFFAAHSVMCPVKTKAEKREQQRGANCTLDMCQDVLTHSARKEVVLHLRIILPITAVLL